METMLKIKAGIMRVLSIVIIFLFAFMTRKKRPHENGLPGR